MAYTHLEPINVQPSGNGIALSGLTISWDVESVSDSTYYYPFIEWRIYLNDNLIHTSSNDDLRSYNYTGTLNDTSDYNIRVERYCEKKDLYGSAYPYYATFSDSSNFRTIEYPQAFSLSSPSDGASGQLDPTLSWTTSQYATSYDVYFGTNASPPLHSNQAGISFSTAGLTPDTTYYWKIVAKNANGTYPSSIRSFTTLSEPSKASDPSPEDTATDVSRNATLSWTGDGTSYDVYFGTNPDPSGNFQGNQATASYSPGTMNANTTYYWRIDSKNAAGTTTGDVWSFTTAEITTGTPADRNYKRLLCACGDNSFYYEDDSVPPKMIKLTGLTLDTAKPVSMFEAYQKVLIANDSNLKVVDFTNTKIILSVALTAPPAKGDILTQDTTGASMIVDFVSADRTTIYGYTYTTAKFGTTNDIVANPSATLDPQTIPNANVTTVTEPTVPHYYDWKPFPDLDGGSDNEFGSMPARATIACLYRGRCFLTGNQRYPHQWYMSRQADPWDWQYNSTDEQSAVAGNDADAGELGDIVTAAIPYSDDYLIIGGDNSIWVMRGDPAAGGSLDQLTLTTGIWSKDAWCWDSSNNLYFMGNNGIYMIPAGLGTPANISKQVIPSLMEDWNLDSELHRVTMSFDQQRHGLLICKTTLDGGDNDNLWFDLRVGTNANGGFFPENYPVECGVYSSHFYKADSPIYRQNLIGCADGYIRTFDDQTKDDDIGATVEAIDSDVLLGPVPISNDSAWWAMTNAQTFVTAGGAVGGTQSDTDSIEYQIFIAETAEEILEQVMADTPTPKYTGTISKPGKSTRKRHRAKGAFMGVRILNTNIGETWAIDRVLADIRNAGRIK